MLLLSAVLALAALAQAGSAPGIHVDPPVAFAGVVTHETLSAAGQDFYRSFCAYWHDKPRNDMYAIAVRERLSARRDNQIVDAYAGRVVFHGALPPARGQIRPLSELAADTAYESVVNANKHKEPVAASKQNALQQFTDLLERSVLSQLSTAASSGVMGAGGKLKPGLVETGNFRIDIVDATATAGSPGGATWSSCTQQTSPSAASNMATWSTARGRRLRYRARRGGSVLPGSEQPDRAEQLRQAQRHAIVQIDSGGHPAGGHPAGRVGGREQVDAWNDCGQDGLITTCIRCHRRRLPPHPWPTQ